MPNPNFPEEIPPESNDVNMEPFLAVLGSHYKEHFYATRRSMTYWLNERVEALKPSLLKNEGLAYYHTYAHGEEYRVLLTTRPEIAGNSQTLITVNRRCNPLTTEPHYPDGRTMHLIDLVVSSKKPERLAYEHEVIWQGQYEHKLSPERATCLYHRDEFLKLHGHIKHTPLHAQNPPKNTSLLKQDVDTLGQVLTALYLCDSSSLIPEVTTVR